MYRSAVTAVVGCGGFPIGFHCCVSLSSKPFRGERRGARWHGSDEGKVCKV